MGSTDREGMAPESRSSDTGGTAASPEGRDAGVGGAKVGDPLGERRTRSLGVCGGSGGRQNRGTNGKLTDC